MASLVRCSLLCPGIPFLCSIFGSVAPVIVLARRLTLSRRGDASCMSACRSSVPLAHPTDEPPMPLHQRNRPAMPPSPQPHTHNRTHNHNHKKKVQLQQQHPQQQEEPLPPSLDWPLRHPASGSFSFAENTSPLPKKIPTPFQTRSLPHFGRRPLPLRKKTPLFLSRLPPLSEEDSPPFLRRLPPPFRRRPPPP